MSAFASQVVPGLAWSVLPFDADAVPGGPGDLTGDDVPTGAEAEACEDEVTSCAAVLAVRAGRFANGIRRCPVERVAVVVLHARIVQMCEQAARTGRVLPTRG